MMPFLFLSEIYLVILWIEMNEFKYLFSLSTVAGVLNNLFSSTLSLLLTLLLLVNTQIESFLFLFTSLPENLQSTKIIHVFFLSREFSPVFKIILNEAIIINKERKEETPLHKW